MYFERETAPPEFTTHESNVARPLVLAVLLGFISQAILTQFVPGGADFVREHLMLSLNSLRHFNVWTFATSPFTDAPLSPFTALFVAINAVFLHLLGRNLAPEIGRRGFWTVVAAAVILGGLCALGSGAILKLPGLAVGSSGILLALSILFCCIHADRTLIPLPLPIPVKGRHLAWFTAGLSIFAFVFFELRGEFFATPPSYLLGSMAAGWLYYRFVHRRAALLGSSSPAVERPAWMNRRRKSAPATTFKVNLAATPPADLRAEVDRILDKINSKGFGALTAEERHILDEARDTLKKR